MDTRPFQALSDSSLPTTPHVTKSLKQWNSPTLKKDRHQISFDMSRSDAVISMLVDIYFNAGEDSQYLIIRFIMSNKMNLIFGFFCNQYHLSFTKL